MILREAKDKWRAYVMPHEPMYHPPHPNQPAMLVSVSFSLQLQSVQTTPMLPNKHSSTPLRFMSLSLFPSFFPSSFRPVLPHPPKKKTSILNVQCSHVRKVGQVILCLIFCILVFTLIKIILYLRTSYMLYVRAMPSKMVKTTTSNEVYFDVKLVRLRASARVYV